MASAVAMVIGGAVVNALALTGGNFLFSKLAKTHGMLKTGMLKKKDRGMTKQSNSWNSSSLESKENAKTGFY